MNRPRRTKIMSVTSVLRLTKGFPTTGDCAGRKGWKLLRTSSYLLKIGRGWKAGWRARIVLMWGQGAGLTAIVRATGKTKRTAYRWRDRYIAYGVAGLEHDAT